MEYHYSTSFPTHVGAVLTSDDQTSQSSTRAATFFQFLLFAVSGVSVIRFIGALWFLGRSGIFFCFARR